MKEPFEALSGSKLHWQEDPKSSSWGWDSDPVPQCLLVAREGLFGGGGRGERGGEALCEKLLLEHSHHQAVFQPVPVGPPCLSFCWLEIVSLNRANVLLKWCSFLSFWNFSCFLHWERLSPCPWLLKMDNGTWGGGQCFALLQYQRVCLGGLTEGAKRRDSEGARPGRHLLSWC